MKNSGILKSLSILTSKKDNKPFVLVTIEIEDDHLYDGAGSFGPMYEKTFLSYDYFMSHSDVLIPDCKVSLFRYKGDDGKYRLNVTL